MRVGSTLSVTAAMEWQTTRPTNRWRARHGGKRGTATAGERQAVRPRKRIESCELYTRVHVHARERVCAACCLLFLPPHFVLRL